MIASLCTMCMSSYCGRLGTRQHNADAAAIRTLGLSLYLSNFINVVSPIYPHERMVQAISYRSTVPSCISASSTGKAPPCQTKVYIRFNAATACVRSRMS